MPIAESIYAFTELDSTMDEARRLIAQEDTEGILIVAERQKQGRGRLGRSWESPLGGAYCSFILKPKRPFAEVPQLSLVMGLALAEILRDSACLYPSIRWPNDLLIHGKKLGGILIETVSSIPRPPPLATEPAQSSLVRECRETLVSRPPRPLVIIGVGINVTTDPAKLPDGSTSLLAEGASHCSREDIIVGLCRRFSAWYDIWTQKGFAPIRESLRPWMGGFGQPVQITAGTDQLQGTATDL
ncbi:MAG: biotin--[acetyl-CoA-carboxylase] ligase, partial [Candidatus Omnitrophica bacterium]|nr:biotin--[acetyl-CoA-carboxylase] ligase [Candidatus Omnitrophota bacterium]